MAITRDGGTLLCSCSEETTAELLHRDRATAPYLADRIGPTRFRVAPELRGLLKQALVAAGYPAEDLAGYVSGDVLGISLRNRTVSGAPFGVRGVYRGLVEETCRSLVTRHRQCIPRIASSQPELLRVPGRP